MVLTAVRTTYLSLHLIVIFIIHSNYYYFATLGLVKFLVDKGNILGVGYAVFIIHSNIYCKFVYLFMTKYFFGHGPGDRGGRTEP